MKFDGEKDFSAEKELSEEECRKIVEGLGLDYLGIQEGYKKLLLLYYSHHQTQHWKRQLWVYLYLYMNLRPKIFNKLLKKD